MSWADAVECTVPLDEQLVNSPQIMSNCYLDNEDLITHAKVVEVTNLISGSTVAILNFHWYRCFNTLLLSTTVRIV